MLVGFARTNAAGAEALAAVAPTGRPVQVVTTPPAFSTSNRLCGHQCRRDLLDGPAAASECFDGYDVLVCPSGEEAAANMIGVNDHVLMRTGFPKTEATETAATT